jgi:hypothetical protein
MVMKVLYNCNIPTDAVVYKLGIPSKPAWNKTKDLINCSCVVLMRSRW